MAEVGLFKGPLAWLCPEICLFFSCETMDVIYIAWGCRAELPPPPYFYFKFERVRSWDTFLLEMVLICCLLAAPWAPPVLVLLSRDATLSPPKFCLISACKRVLLYTGRRFCVWSAVNFDRFEDVWGRTVERFFSPFFFLLITFFLRISTTGGCFVAEPCTSSIEGISLRMLLPRQITKLWPQWALLTSFPFKLRIGKGCTRGSLSPTPSSPCPF